MLGLNADVPSPGALPARSEKIGKGFEYRLASYDNFRRLDLFVRLRVITDISKEHAAGSFHQQRSGAAGESAKVSEVGEMADQQSVEAGDGEMLPEDVLARNEVH